MPVKIILTDKRFGEFQYNVSFFRLRYLEEFYFVATLMTNIYIETAYLISNVPMDDLSETTEIDFYRIKLKVTTPDVKQLYSIGYLSILSFE